MDDSDIMAVIWKWQQLHPRLFARDTDFTINLATVLYNQRLGQRIYSDIKLLVIESSSN